MKPNSKIFDYKKVVINTFSILLLVSFGLASTYSTYLNLNHFDQDNEIVILPEAESNDSLEKIDGFFNKIIIRRKDDTKNILLVLNFYPINILLIPSDYSQTFRRPPRV